MQFNKKWFPVLLVLVLVGGYFAVKQKNNAENSTQNISTSTTNILNSDSNSGYTIEQIPNKEVSIPDLNRKVIFGSGVSFDENTKTLVSNKIVEVQNKLKKDSKDLAAWLELGIYQKMAGDYDGALISWKYLTEVSNDSTAFGNIGDLYAYYIKDKTMSETYYKKAIKNSPTQVYLYTQLAGVYKDVFRDVAKASAVIDEGLKMVPGDKTLLQYKNNLK